MPSRHTNYTSKTTHQASLHTELDNLRRSALKGSREERQREMNYDILIRPLPEDEGGGFVGFIPDLQGCMSDGDTPEEAVRNTLEAMKEWMELHTETGRAIPEPGTAMKRAIKREEALISAIHVLTEKNGQLEHHVQEVEEAMSHLLDMIRDNTGWSFRASGNLLRRDRCEA